MRLIGNLNSRGCSRPGSGEAHRLKKVNPMNETTSRLHPDRGIDQKGIDQDRGSERVAARYSMTIRPTQIERATIYLGHNNMAEQEFLNSWFDRWAGALVMRSQETLTGGSAEMYDVIAPARALNELPNAVVVRY